METGLLASPGDVAVAARVDVVPLREAGVTAYPIALGRQLSRLYVLFGGIGGIAG